MARSSRLQLAGLAAAYLLPAPLAIVSPRSAAACLVVALLVLIASDLQQAKARILAGWRNMLISRLLFWTLIAVLLLAPASSYWSIAPHLSLVVAAKLVSMTLVGMLWYFSFDARHSRTIFWLLFLGGSFAAVLLLLELNEITAIVGLFNDDHAFSRYNRPCLIAFLSSCLAVILASREGDPGLRLLAWGLYLLMGLAVLTSLSETVKLLLLAFPLLWAGFSVLPPYLARLTGFAPLAIYAVFPLAVPHMTWLMAIASKAAPESLLAQSAAGARIQLWNQFLDAAYQRPWLGWGFGAERDIPLPEVPGALYHDVWSHPHSLPIQTLVNLGWSGFVLVALLLFAFGLANARQNGKYLASSGALSTCIMITWCISHGAWQSWWIAIIAILLTPLMSRPVPAADTT